MPRRRLVLSEYINEPPPAPDDRVPLISVSVLQPFNYHDMVDCLSVPTRTPLVKQHMTVESRLKTFGPLFDCVKTPEELSSNGFFWVGPWVEPGITILDHVRCFWCKATLLCWEESDIIAEEHMRIRPDCPFARKTVNRPPTATEKHEAINLWKDTQRVKYVRRHGIPPHIVYAALEDIYDNIYPFPDSQGLLEAVARVLENSVVTCKPESRIDSCKVCLTNQVSVLFVPCGHLACCMPCSKAFNSCPVCKGKVRGRVVARLT